MTHDWKPKRLRIADVKERADLQLRAGGVNAAHLKDVVKALERGDVLPPIKVAKIGRAQCVIDGFHRLEASRTLGRTATEALVAPMDLGTARAFARIANDDHGLKRTNKDKASVFDNYVAYQCHLTDDGEVKGSRTISAELRGGYSHTQVLRALRLRGIAPNLDVEVAAGSKWGGGYDGDGGEDLDDLNATDDASVGPLDAEHSASIRSHADAIEPLFFALGDRHKALALGAVRDLIGRLEANVVPAVPEASEEVNLDI